MLIFRGSELAAGELRYSAVDKGKASRISKKKSEKKRMFSSKYNQPNFKSTYVLGGKEVQTCNFFLTKK